MEITPDKLKQLLKQLKGLDWCIMSGLAVEIYTKGKRKAGNDIDLLVSQTNIYQLAKRLGCPVKRRKFKKATFWVNDYGFETSFANLQLEVSSGFPLSRMEDKSIGRIFAHKQKRKYLGLEVYVEPIEELIAHKIRMSREKDIRDLKLLAQEKKDRKLLEEFLRDWGIYHQAIKQLNALHFFKSKLFF